MMVNRKNILVEISSIIIFAFGIFGLIALFTYHSNDPTFTGQASALARNSFGRMGAFFSAPLLNCFGIGAFVLPVSFFLVSATIHRREGLLSIAGTLSGIATSVASLTVFLALHWQNWFWGGTQFLTGGIFGAWVAQAMLNSFNYLGSSIVALVVLSISIALTTPFSVAHWGGKVIASTLRFLGRLLKLLTTYGLYLLGLVAMRFAYFAGDGLKNLIASAARVSKKRALIKVAEKSVTVVKSTVLPPEAQAEWVAAAICDEQVQQKAEEVAEVLAPGGIKIMPREVDAALKEGQKQSRPAIKSLRGQWQLPPVEFLKNPPSVEGTVDRERLISNSQILKQKFADFGIDGEVTAVRPGPVITLYEFKPGPGVKVSRIAALADDLSMALSAQSVRILAPLPGKSVVGIEIPSETRETVYLREFLQHTDFYGTKHSIPVVMGKDIGGQTYLSDLARMPHLLCAGQTGSGKSVFMNGLICSLFYRFTPDELRMILVDPKFIEFRAYQDIPHLLLPVVDDPKQASIALKWAVREMERRYRILAKLGARNLASFNQKVDEMGSTAVGNILFSEESQAETSTSVSGGDWIEAFEPDESGVPRVSKLPYIVVIIDELADLMMIAKKEVEISIARIAQKARAAGIHLIIATQRPSTDVITGLIKANLPSRVSFQLASYVDSKTILDRAGAERLLGQGDMLFIPPGVSQNLRLHGAFLDDEEINKITQFLKGQGKPAYRDEILLAEDEDSEGGGLESEDEDELLVEAVELVKRSGHASASFLQRHLKVGYNRAARMIETMETRGIVGPQEGSRPRDVLMS